MSDDTRDLDDAAFAERIVARIEAEGRLAEEATLKEALRVGSAACEKARGRRRGWPGLAMVLAAAAGALLAVGVTLALRSGSAGDGVEAPRAFDGGAGVGPVEPGGGGAGEVRRDGQGRIAELVTRGSGGEERLIFRSGRLVRVEQLRGGKVHGMAVDFDGAGRVVAVKTWVDGVERGPWLELGPSGLVERSGVVE